MLGVQVGLSSLFHDVLFGMEQFLRQDGSSAFMRLPSLLLVALTQGDFVLGAN